MNRRAEHQAGMTLIESMVAMTISAVLIVGSISMYSQARNNYRTTESIARMQENLRFSIDILDEDVRLAGFWGKAAGASFHDGISDVSITCAGNQARGWVLRNNDSRVTAIQALQDVNEVPADCRGADWDPRANSDVLIVRRASTFETEPANGVIQLQSSFGSVSFFDDNADPGNPAMTEKIESQVNDLEFSAYYVSNTSKYDAELPSLRRLTLVGNRIEDNELIPGVENLQIQFGIDSNGDGLVDMTVNGDEVNGRPIISAKLWMLVRAETNEAGQGYQDNKGPYIPPDESVAQIDPLGDDADTYPPTFRRMAMSRSIVLRNAQ